MLNSSYTIPSRERQLLLFLGPSAPRDPFVATAVSGSAVWKKILASKAEEEAARRQRNAKDILHGHGLPKDLL